MDEFCELLPQCATETYKMLNKCQRETLTEIRMRINRKIYFCFGGTELDLNRLGYKGSCIYGITDANATWMRLCNDAPYSKINEQRQGYITFKGYRVGLSGRFSGRDSTLNGIFGFCIRIMHEIIGCANDFYRRLFYNNIPVNSLIVSPPGCGKTTLLRDIVRLLSIDGFNIALIDEREELSAPFNGLPTLNIGERCDVICGLSKEIALENAVRSLKPDIIALDEIGSDDIRGVNKAVKFGVTVIATAHGKCVRDATERFGNVFEKYILLEGIGKPKKIFDCEGLPCL